MLNKILFVLLEAGIYQLREYVNDWQVQWWLPKKRCSYREVLLLW